MSEYVYPSLWILAGLVLLVAGGEMLIRGASRLALALRIAPLVVGLTVVALATSSPEMAVCVQAAYAGSADLVVGNVVGSNIANVLLILGISALLSPISVSSRIIRYDVPLMIAASAAVWLMALDGQFGRLDGAVLVAVLITYNVWLIRSAGKESPEVVQEYETQLEPPKSTGPATIVFQLVLVALGVASLVAGANWLVYGAVDIAQRLGVSELVVGLTIVAVGTSLPEVAASVIATFRKSADIVVGNVVGSNLLNILSVLAMAALVAPAGVPVSGSAFSQDIPVMIAAAVACLPVFFSGQVVNRAEGGLFLFAYAVYITYLVLDATGYVAAKNYTAVFMGAVALLAAFPITHGVWQTLQVKRGNTPNR